MPGTPICQASRLTSLHAVVQVTHFPSTRRPRPDPHPHPHPLSHPHPHPCNVRPRFRTSGLVSANCRSALATRVARNVDAFVTHCDCANGSAGGLRAAIIVENVCPSDQNPVGANQKQWLETGHGSRTILTKGPSYVCCITIHVP